MAGTTTTRVEPMCVLLTCAASPMAVEMLQALGRCREMPVRVIGVDVQDQGPGRHFADGYHRVPKGDDPAYPQLLLEVCRRERVKVVIPASDEEALALARVRRRFEGEGIHLTVPREELVEPLSGKTAMYAYLAARGVPVPAYALVSTVPELEAAAARLGYPAKPFIVKPAAARGGRGVWLVREGGATMDELVREMSLDVISLDTLREAARRKGALAPLVAMEHLPGRVWDVDILARKGELLYLVSRRRYHPRTTPFRGCVLEKNDAVLDLARKIHEALQLDHLHDVDIVEGEDGRPALLEVNPRHSASVIATVAAGLNLLEYLVYVALGKPVPQVAVPWGKGVKPSIRTSLVEERK